MRLKHLLFTFALTTIFLIAGKVGWGQESIFNETFGTPSATTAVNSYTGWSSSATFSSNTADVRTSSASAGYTGASASGNVMMNAVGEYLLISGISTAGYTNISLSLGLRKGTSAENGSTLAIEVSDNGTDWVPLTYTLPTGTGTATWHYITPTGTIPATATLSIRFTPSSTVEFRLDDISLQGELPDAVAPVPTFDPVDAATGVAITVNPTITFDETIYTAAGVLVDNSNVESLITFTDGTDPVAFTATITDKVITIVPSADLANAIEHTVTIAAVEDAAGNLMAAPASASFTTIAAGAKAINITGPEANEVFTVQTVNVTFTVANFNIPSEGKVKYTLTPSGTGSITSGEVTASPINLTELTEDAYTIELELVDVDGASLVPTVTASIQFSVNLEDVATPTFTPVAGTYYSTQNVEITCATADAEIRYTTNGDEPSESSSLYSTPIEVSATTTIKAKAFKAGMTPSALATAAYTIVTPTDVADIAALRASAADNTTVYKLTSAATITQTDSYNNRKYIQDASGAILIYDPNPAKITGTYNVGDGITNVIGKLYVSNEMLRFTPVADAETTSSNPAIAPEVKALDAITVDDEAKLVKVVNVIFNPATGTFATANNYTLEDGAANTLVLRTDFFSADYIGTDIPTTSVTLTGVLVDYKGTMQFTPRNLADFQSAVATLTDLKVNDVTVTDFDAATLTYSVELPFGAAVPAVTATATSTSATLDITQATVVDGGVATVLVTAQDGVTTKTYTINFTEAAAKTDATLSALTVNGIDVLAYDGLVVDPSTEPGATMWFNNFTDAMGIVATQNDADATVSIKKNDVEVVDPANETLADNDVILITVTAQDVAVVKYYKITLQQKPIITATAGANGTIAPPGAVVVDYDGTQAFTATAASGYHIAALNVNGTPVAEAANQTEYTYTFNNVVADATIDATFEITKYTVTFTVKEGTTPLEGATVALSGGYSNQVTNASGVATFADVVPNLLAYTVTLDGYNNVEGNVTVDGNKNVDIAMVSSAVPTYSVIFTVKEGEVAVEAATVTLTGYGEQQTNASGVATFTGVPASADVAYTVNKTGFVEATGAVTVVDADVNQAVALTRVNYTIAASAGENGTITPTGDVSVAHGNNQAFDVEAASGYHIASLLVNGTEVAEAAGVASYTYTFSNVTAAQTIAATFAINTYTITVTAGENGTTTPAANQTVNHGGEVVFTIAANEGYHIKDVLVDGVSVGAVASYTFTNVTANASIETQFEINSYTVTAFAAPTAGGVITGAGSYTHLQEVTLTATPNEGYTFVRWRSGATTLSTSATYVFNATADVEVAAVFTQFTGDLFFSEYIEGSSNNKAFEIYNPNGTAVDLTKYKVKLSNNGAGFGIPSGQTVEDTRYVLPLTGTLAAGEVLVVANASAIQAILDKADVTLAYNSTANGCDGCNVVSFNGDDALGLFKDDVLIDVVGEGVHDDTNNPIDGWDVAGTTLATKDYTLVRKSSVTEGTTTWNESAGTDADNSQWIVYPKDNVDYLGTHNVVLPSNEAEIFTYTFAEQAGAATISSATGLIEIEVISSADLTSLVASFTTSENATVKVADVAQVSGTTPNDFSADVIYTVTAEDGTVKQWTVRVTKSAAQSSEKAILTYSINEVDATIDANAYTVAVTLPYGTDLTALVATFTVSPGASAKVADVAQVSGTTANDFTAAVVYVVTAEDGSTQNWTVTVSTEAPLTGKDILTYTIAEVDATVNATDHSVTATLPYGTDVTALVATFTLSEEATAKVADVEQVSGTTANDFTNPVVYTVTAQDGTTQDWTVTIALGAASSEAFVTSTVYTVDDTEGTITAVPYGTTLAAFKANITPANYATFEVYQADGTTVATVLETGYKLIVTAQDEVANKTYTITVAEPSSSDLFFSEYIEGSSNNKAIEIYNPTGSAISLANYRIAQAANGGGWLADVFHTFPEGASIAAGDVWVIITDQVSTDYFDKANADEVLAYPSVAHHTGNDARALQKTENGTDWVTIDVFGDPTSSVNFDVAGVTGAAGEHTLVRKGSVTSGNTDWAASAGTDADNSEWIVYPQNTFTYLGTHSTSLSSAAEITAFSFAEQVAAATIDATSGTITIEVLYGTDLTGLVSTFTVSAGAKAYVNDVLQVSGTTANNFTNDVVYKVVAEDGTIKEWTVTVTMPAQPSTAAEIVSFVLAEQTGSATINSAAGTIAIEVNSTADLTALTPTIQVSAGASISPASGAVQDFTNPVTYTVTAQDNNTTKPWTVTVTKPQVNVVTIAQIQQPTGDTGDSPYINQIVQTTGIVTAIQAGKGFFIQDGEGAWSGILVYTNTATGLPAIGDEVKVKGWVKEFYSYTEITTNATPAVTVETTVLSSGNTLPAATVLTSQAVQAEEYEGVLVKVVSAEVISGPSATHNEYIVNDGSGDLTVDDKLFLATFTVGSRYSITGVMDYSFDAFKLLPRDASDIATGIDDVKWGVNLEVYPNPFTNTINFSNVEDVELITVTNLIGQRVMTVKPESSNSINTDNLIKGIYLVSFQNRDGKVIVKKMIKQ
ncbi:Lamin Tail Domain protein [anaerobic digester metagenome]